MTTPIRALGYVRVSTEEQAASGLSVEHQREAIRQAVEQRGWELSELHEDLGVSAKTTNRPQLQAALAQLARRRPREFETLVVTRLDRLTRSVKDLAFLLEQASREGWKVVILDLGVDTTTPQGEALANCMAAFAQLERRLIGQRTKEALAAKKVRGESVGRPRVISPESEARIVELARAGHSRLGIARLLMADGVPAPLGGARWHDTTVEQVLRRHPEIRPSGPPRGRGRPPRIRTV